MIVQGACGFCGAPFSVELGSEDLFAIASGLTAADNSTDEKMADDVVARLAEAIAGQQMTKLIARLRSLLRNHNCPAKSAAVAAQTTARPTMGFSVNRGGETEVVELRAQVQLAPSDEPVDDPDESEEEEDSH
jgi:uncharacterized protein HemY